VVFKHEGTFDKYLGDAIMCFYGAPLAQADHPLRAVQTALEMQAVFRALQGADPTLAGLGLGVGLHSGEATVGNIGSEKVMDYTVIGDVVNVAKRLTEEAPAGEILFSEATYDFVREIVEAEALGPRPIRGRAQPVTVFTMRLDPPGPATPSDGAGSPAAHSADAAPILGQTTRLTPLPPSDGASPGPAL
jgi:adenylate cyclase